MPAWIHDRANHIQAKNPSMPKSEAFAIATQQSHALGKSPKGYGTAQGRETAKAKYKTPEDDKKTASSFAAFSDELQKAAWQDALPGGLADEKKPKDFPPTAVRKGRKVESEHTKDKHLQTEIAMDHLTEDPKYYGKLEKMEKDGMDPSLLGKLKAVQSVKPALRLKKAPGQFLAREFNAQAARAPLAHLEMVADPFKAAFATSAYSGPLNPLIESGASFQPPRKAPTLQRAIQKQAAGAPTRGNFMMASDIPAFRAPRLDRAIQKDGALETKEGAPGGFIRGLGQAARRQVQHLKDDLVDLNYQGPQGHHGAGALMGTAGIAGGLVGAGYAAGRHQEKQKAAESDGMFRTKKDDEEEDARLKKKEGDMLPDYITYGPGDFKKSKYAMSLEDMGAFVRELQKEADVSPAVPWNGGTGNPHRMASDVPPFRAPRLDRAIQKEGSMSPAGQLNKSQHVGAPKSTAPPGPSIADIAKPKGAKFGIGIPGAFKTKL